MPDFQAQLRPASFRGLAFKVPQDDREGGRRLAVHEYPGKDQAYIEDMGLSISSFSFEAVIIGDDFMAQAGAFEVALNAPGAGTLIHPHLGEIQIRIERYRRSHAIDAAGEVRFSCSAFLDGKAIYPSSKADTASGLLNAADKSFTALLQDFISRFHAPDLDFLLNDATGRVTDFTGSIRSILSRSGILNLVSGDLFGALDVASGGFASGVVSAFQTLADVFKPVSARIVGTSDQAMGTGRDALVMVRSMASASAISVADATGTTPGSQAVRVENAQALDLLFRQGAVAAAVQAARFADYESKADAVSMRAQLTGQIGQIADLMAAAGWEKSLDASGGLAAAVSRDINERIGRLPRTAIFSPGTQMPSIVVAHRLYGSDLPSLFDKADDIVKRNKIRHPGFMPTEGLEVLLN